ncbi:Stress responsive alpha-beta barrel domain-containing protein [Oleidesulfovibrio alaskensis G20]|jgi:predicted house-cleaning NTP pyrophosphatase (Maf/HAM1 superfamily)|uniref:Stress responsive alpha-beta barrel domain-containing protein n=1 Tax=Oleidesulfovibrio alaskensis (strain ATCC BAA-1058 / DSM 17464 / G20) TaxID=207559 RepID=Q317A1_OLEA2|nr:Dabb family protein [Oleidesulfovibrio alaskensis]ABB36995.1 Stress responsive alpha-beta barrel domain-containing protein [Oleidesulfovibrio alaskensis G20]MBG0774513.1 Dabb family protein [Oleidesulfovibrio alaskensis]MBL3582816.1 Dabb family protein [Oleidesulfovibrio alaskensis]
MIKHIVWWTLKEEAEGATAAENAEKMIRMLRELDGRIPSLMAIEASSAIAATTTEQVDVILQTVHASAEDLQAYAEHPEHVKCVGFIKAVVSGRKAIDYEV